MLTRVLSSVYNKRYANQENASTLMRFYGKFVSVTDICMLITDIHVPGIAQVVLDKLKSDICRDGTSA